MKNKALRLICSFVARVFLRTIVRCNPFCKPLVPALVTMNILALTFTILTIRDQILSTFIVEYKEITLSAWGFVLLMNFLEALMETYHENDDKG